MPSNPEDIMAEYLLKGGKMLDKTCPSCGSPLFLVKGETMCVVCNKAQEEAQADVKKVAPESGQKLPDFPESAPEDYAEVVYADDEPEVSDDLRGEIEKTMIHFCKKARKESKPKDCLMIMECIRIADDVLKGR
ncbi:Sjogren's syndrome/scleroderma autoantigen 1 family protein [Methanolacinia paynteri]|uniref:Sjogren's syndrome/scleroderma autoantigen 1 family protein n=1 Tax=Methanolacinia paynteri TaxID=230356 RepID=UPI00064EA464|nr:Sjogren's syndrome/scleroderma autoantigen 1 family protein [Methanolacinia paynteri]